jgi:hypothetical protein
MNLITDLQYFPSVILFKNSFKYSHIIFEQYEFYQKASFRNRMLIANANGIAALSVPLEGGRDQKKLIKEVRLDNRKPWQMNHWKNLESAYNRSPWFEYYRESLLELYYRPFVFLVDWNLTCFEWSIRQIGLDQVTISWTNSFRPTYDPDKNLDLRNRILPKNYQLETGPRYRQVFEEKLGFIPNLSILDLLFCEGKRAGEILRHDEKFT